MTQSPRPIWILTRLAAVGLILAISLLYFPINRMVSGGVAARLPLDDLIPLWPVWAVPYLASLIWWPAAILWIALGVHDERGFRAFALAMLIANLSAYAIYIVYPTYVIRPEVSGEGWDYDLIRWIYSGDQPYNALPSGHTYTTTLLAITLWRFQPRLRWLWAASVVAVILATLFTKQHYVLDPLAGLIWAFGADWIGRRIIRPLA